MKNRSRPAVIRANECRATIVNNRMLAGFFFVFTLFLVLAGCANNQEPIPQIVDRRSRSEPFYQSRPKSIKLPPVAGSIDSELPKGWQPPLDIEKKWVAVVIHHSGTSNGNATIFDRWHRQGNHWEGVGYDFVIGNGTDSADGEVEVTFRWLQQRTGAHCKTPDNWANERAVGICLVGNFNETDPTLRQMQSLLRLVRFLQRRYGITRQRVYGHNTTPDAGATDCPGRRFPMARFKSELEF